MPWKFPVKRKGLLVAKQTYIVHLPKPNEKKKPTKENEEGKDFSITKSVVNVSKSVFLSIKVVNTR
jgi:hypothetical protein